MAVDITKMRAYTDGAVYTHDVGAAPAAPTNAGSALNVLFKEIGAISDEGLSQSFAQDRTDVFIWQKNALARRIPGQTTLTYTFAATETSLLTLGVYYAGSTITRTVEGASVAVKAPGTDIRGWVLHGMDGARAVRVYVPLGEVTGRGDVVYNSAGITAREFTLTAYVDGNGNFAYEYHIDPSMAL